MSNIPGPYDAIYFEEACQHWIKEARSWRRWAWFWAIVAGAAVLGGIQITVTLTDNNKPVEASK